MQSMTDHAKHRGNPNWVKGGPSPNPSGRPRSGLALAERIRERVTPDQLIDLVTEALGDVRIDIEKRVSLAMQLASYGYSRPATGVDLLVQGSSGASSSADWSAVPIDERRAILAEIRTRLDAAKASRASEQQSDQPLVTDETTPSTGHLLTA